MHKTLSDLNKNTKKEETGMSDLKRSEMSNLRLVSKIDSKPF